MDSGKKEDQFEEISLQKSIYMTEKSPQKISYNYKKGLSTQRYQNP
jgi:hypothetical protein